jgi:hypothetical protein
MEGDRNEGRIINGGLPSHVEESKTANRLRAFHTFLEYCPQYEPKVEFWDVHFSQGSYEQLQTNEN